MSSYSVREVIQDKKAIIEESEKKEDVVVNEWGYEFIHNKEEGIIS